MKKEQSVPKRRHIKFSRRGITQKKTYKIQNTTKVWYQENQQLLQICISFMLIDARDQFLQELECILMQPPSFYHPFHKFL
jgi:Holliday junction resolvase-like predicted endonuclease